MRLKARGHLSIPRDLSSDLPKVTVSKKAATTTHTIDYACTHTHAREHTHTHTIPESLTVPNRTVSLRREWVFKINSFKGCVPASH